MRVVPLLSLVLLPACIARPAADADPEPGAAPMECAEALDLRRGQARPPEGYDPRAGFVVRGLGSDRVDPSAACIGPPGRNGRELRVTFTADSDGVHTFTGSGGAGHLYLLDAACAAPVACANAGLERRALMIDLDAGQRVALAFDAEDAQRTEPLEIAVLQPAAPRGWVTVRDAAVTAGADGLLGVDLRYHADGTDRMMALPFLEAVVTRVADGATARVPLTGVEAVGHGLMTVAGAISDAAAWAPGDAVEVVVEDRRDGQLRWASEPVAVTVGGARDQGWYGACLPGLWDCSPRRACAGLDFQGPAEPGPLRQCRGD